MMQEYSTQNEQDFKLKTADVNICTGIYYWHDERGRLHFVASWILNVDDGNNAVMLHFIEEADTGGSISKTDLVVNKKQCWDSK